MNEISIEDLKSNLSAVVAEAEALLKTMPYYWVTFYTAVLGVAGVAANALLFTLKGHGISQYRDNLIPKLLFWPYLLGACFDVTLIFLC
jgi:hypothetical protein